MPKQRWLLGNTMILLICILFSEALKKEKGSFSSLETVTYYSTVDLTNGTLELNNNKSRLPTIPGAKKLAELRSLMKNVADKDTKGIEAYIVTSSDAHMSEYTQAKDKRREYISGFKGSAGTVVVTLDKALLWTDGRYFAEAKIELDPPESWTLMKDGLPETPSIEAWLSDNLPPNSTIGFDPNLMDETTASRIKNTLNLADQNFLPIDKNLVDEVWGKDKPAAVLNKIVPQKFIHTGKIAADKVKECFEQMKKNKASALVLAALDEIVYLLNWRGSDIPYNPVFFSYVVLFAKKVHIFVEENRLTTEARQQLLDEKVDFQIHPYKDVRIFLKKICSQEKSVKKVWVSSSSSYALHKDCESVHIYKTSTPIKLMKIVKNEVEIAGLKSAHIKDGAAIVKYFAWLEDQILNNPKKVITEISGAQQLEKFRHEQKNYIGPSFTTISASGEHGAIIHYSPSPKTDAPITSHGLYLCDTGTQFPEGTTDVTRTLHFGQPTGFETESYTRVFKGQSNLSRAKFPLFVKSHRLDTLARRFLWDVGLDYGHGTGHGIGSYLNVHEYPPLIHIRPYPEDPGFQPGMFVSNEPGYYEDGKFGIRLENIELTVKANTTYDRSDGKFLTFETVTMVPYQRKLLNISMLTDDEINHLNDYHKKCLEILKPLFKGPENNQALKWLERETQPIHRN